MGVAMMMIMVIGGFVGVVLGLRFRVSALASAVCLALVVVAVQGFVRGESVWATAVPMFVGATSLQIGYLGGVILRVVRHRLVADRKPQDSEAGHSAKAP